MVSFFGGSPVNKPTELAYAQITAEFDVANGTTPTVITGLDFTFKPDSGQKYCLEFFSTSVEENSGTAVGDVMVVHIMLDGVTVGYGFSVNGTGGIGGALYIKTQTLIGDGTSHTITCDVGNSTAGANGAIVYANAITPAYIRATRL